MENGKMEKKISFGFKKITKQPTIVGEKPKKEEKTVEFIECLEGQAIKIKDAVVEEEKGPLVIPLKENERSILDRVRAKQKESDLKQDKSVALTEKLRSELTLDELAAQALIKEAENRENNKSENAEKVHELPQLEADQLLEGAEEPTIEDYEMVPFTDYGRAMIRGMGWKDGTGLGKNLKLVKEIDVKPRPKALGLGAEKKIAEKLKEAADKDKTDLVLKVNALAKILAGRHEGQYCQVQSVDDDDLVIVKTAIKGEVLPLSGTFLIPVTKEEYSKCSRVLNNEKYEEYKIKADKNLEKQRRAIRAKEDAANNLVSRSIDEPSSSRKYHDDKRSSHSHSHKTATTSDSDNNTDSSRSNKKSLRKSTQKKTKENNHSSSSGLEDNSGGSKEVRRRRHSRSSESDSVHYRNRKDRKSHRESSRNQRRKSRDRSSSSSNSTPDRSRRNRSSNYRSRSSSCESGYEHHKRRRNKTKCRHRRYSDDESEKTYKKHKKSKRKKDKSNKSKR